MQKMKILFLDIETTPNLVFTWTLWPKMIPIGNIVDSSNILCWGAKWLGQKKVQYSSIQDQDPQVMLSEIWALLDEADVVVHYNGKKFDIPRLNQEFLKYGLGPPAPYAQVDLYRVVKRNFGLVSNKLDWVAQYFGLGKKLKHTGMDLWIDCMKGDAKAWRLMKKYNIRDVRLTEKVYAHLLPWIDGHPNHGLFNGVEIACPNCGGTKLQKRGLSYTKAFVYQRYVCMNTKCGKWSRGKRNVNKDVFTEENPGSLRG